MQLTLYVLKMLKNQLIILLFELVMSSFWVEYEMLKLEFLWIAKIANQIMPRVQSI